MADVRPSLFTTDNTPVDTDLFPYMADAGAGSFVNRKMSWLELKAAMSTGLNAKSSNRLNANRTLTSATTAQAIFNSPANGRVTLTAGTYLVEGGLLVTGMSATSGNALINLLGAGTATITQWMWYTDGIDTSTPGTPVAGGSSYLQTSSTAASVAVAAVGTALGVRFKGSFNMTVGGTMIPSISLVTAAAAIVQAGSWIEFERIGAASLTSIGAWD